MQYIRACLKLKAFIEIAFLNFAVLGLVIHPWVGAMSTSECWDVNRHTARCTSPVSVVWQCKLVSG